MDGEVIDARAWAEQEVIIALAGPVAQRLATRGSEPGWRRQITYDQSKAFHESGHAVAAWSAIRNIYSATITEHISDAGLRIEDGSYGGNVQTGVPRTESEAEFRLPPRSDFRIVSSMCQLLAGSTDWKSVLRVAKELRRQTETLLRRTGPPSRTWHGDSVTTENSTSSKSNAS